MAACDHLVQFYDTDDELMNAVVPYLSGGLDADESVLVIATAPHRLALERELGAAGCGLEQAIAAGTFVSIEAAEILHYLQEDGGDQISASDFDATVGMLVRRQLTGGRRLRVYGEIVALLWDRGQASAAIAVEEMWNDLQSQQPFKLFCGYPVVSAQAQLDAVPHVCRAHSLVLPALSEEPQVDGTPVAAEFAPSLEAPRRVRALLRSTLAELRLDDELIERLILAASELAANAVVHAHTPFRLLVKPRPESVWIAVEDHDPLLTPFDVVGCTPHGLGLIAALAVRWGVIPAEAGKTVWAEIPQ